MVIVTYLDPVLLNVLACPCDRHSPVTQDGDRLVCDYCQAAFPIRDGIPVMLLEEATPGPSGQVGVAASS